MTHDGQARGIQHIKLSAGCRSCSGSSRGTCIADTDSPTRMNLTVTKARLKSAQTGHSLLAKKRDALTTRFRQILKKVDEVGLALSSHERNNGAARS